MSKTAREIAEDLMTEFVRHSQICVDHVAVVAWTRAVESDLLEYAKAEREACVKIALEAATENAHSDKWVGACRLISERIRERGE